MRALPVGSAARRSGWEPSSPSRP